MIGRVRLVSVFRRLDVASDQTVSSQLQDTDVKSRDATLHPMVDADCAYTYACTAWCV